MLTLTLFKWHFFKHEEYPIRGKENMKEIKMFQVIL
jgi:hypothetical protein